MVDTEFSGVPVAKIYILQYYVFGGLSPPELLARCYPQIIVQSSKRPHSWRLVQAKHHCRYVREAQTTDTPVIFNNILYVRFSISHI